MPYVVDPSLVHQISKGMLTLPRMHETPEANTSGDRDITPKRERS